MMSNCYREHCDRKATHYIVIQLWGTGAAVCELASEIELHDMPGCRDHCRDTSPRALLDGVSEADLAAVLAQRAMKLPVDWKRSRIVSKRVNAKSARKRAAAQRLEQAIAEEARAAQKRPDVLCPECGDPDVERVDEYFVCQSADCGHTWLRPVVISGESVEVRASGIPGVGDVTS